MTQQELRFDGATYEPAKDGARLFRQLDKVKYLMMDGKWRTIRGIAEYAECSESSASARLRDLRKLRFGSYIVERKRDEDIPGLFLYRIKTGE